MLRIASFIVAALACTGCQHSASLYEFRTEPDAVFIASGANPSWSLKVSRTSISFKDKSGRIEQKIAPSYFGSGQFRDRYHSDNISFSTHYAACFDHASRKHRNSTTTVTARGVTFRGCGGGTVDLAKNHLAVTNWRIDKIDGRAPIKNAMTEIRFSNGRLIAFVGCNRLSRDYSLKNGEIALGSLQTTYFECSDAEKLQEQRFLEIIGKRANFEFDRFGNLIVQHPERGQLVMSQTV